LADRFFIIVCDGIRNPCTLASEPASPAKHAKRTFAGLKQLQPAIVPQPHSLQPRHVPRIIEFCSTASKFGRPYAV